MATRKTAEPTAPGTDEAPKAPRARAKKADAAPVDAAAEVKAPSSRAKKTADEAPTTPAKTTRATAKKPAAADAAAPKATRAKKSDDSAAAETTAAKPAAKATTTRAKKTDAAATEKPKTTRATAKKADDAAASKISPAKATQAEADTAAPEMPESTAVPAAEPVAEAMPSPVAAVADAVPAAVSAEAQSRAPADEAPVVAAPAAAAPAAEAEADVPLSKRGRPRTRLEDLAPGTEMEGKVLSIATFGFFVDIGAMTDGLVHVSELGQRRMKVGDVVKVGEAVRVRVKEVDLNRGRVALTMRPQVPNPMSDLKVGDVISGKITTITKYGAFVDIDSDTEGLVHISELSSGYVNSIEEVVRPGETVEVRVKEVDAVRRRIGLTMVGLAADQARESERQADRDARDGERASRRAEAQAEEEVVPYEEPEHVPTVIEMALMRALGQIEGDEESSRQNKGGKRKSADMYDVYTRMLEDYRSGKTS